MTGQVSPLPGSVPGEAWPYFSEPQSLAPGYTSRVLARDLAALPSRGTVALASLGKEWQVASVGRQALWCSNAGQGSQQPLPPVVEPAGVGSIGGRGSRRA